MRVYFWDWDSAGDTWRGISLAPGEKVEFTHGGRCEEGSHHYAETFTHGGDHIAHTWADWGRDCDGAYQHGGESTCALDQLEALDPVDDGPRRPNWQPVDRWQRDHSAEMAGY
jgi:hypothetical protein